MWEVLVNNSMKIAKNDAEKAIAFSSAFDVGAMGEQNGFMPYSTESDWTWILVLNNDGTWEVVNYGNG